MIRSKGEAGTGDVSNATTHMRQIRAEIRRLQNLPEDELYVAAKELQAPYDLVKEVAQAGKLPVVLFTAGGIATPADAAMMMQLGAEGVFVGSGIFKSDNPAQRAEAIVKATTFFDDPDVIAKVSRGLARPWSASTSTRSRSRTGWPSEAGSRAGAHRAHRAHGITRPASPGNLPPRRVAGPGDLRSPAVPHPERRVRHPAAA